jgi:hypothetical protein
MHTLQLLALAPLLASCGVSFYHTPPPPRTATVTTYDKPFEKVWSSAVSWFAANDIAIEKIEKPSGLITAKRQVDLSESMVDVGELSSSWNSHGLSITSCMVSLNVFVAPVENGRTQVTVNAFGRFTAVAYHGWLTKLEPGFYEGPCNSNGKLETMIAEHIAGQL